MIIEIIYLIPVTVLGIFFSWNNRYIFFIPNTDLCVGGSGDGTSRTGSRSAALGDKRGCVGPSHGEDGIRKATVVDKGRNAQKTIQKVGDRHIPREEVGTDEPG